MEPDINSNECKGEEGDQEEEEEKKESRGKSSVKKDSTKKLKISIFSLSILKQFDPKEEFLKRGINDKGRVLCPYCGSEIFCTKYDIKRHLANEKHQENQKSSDVAMKNYLNFYFQPADFTKRAELIWGILTAKNDLSLNLSNEVNQFFKLMFSDSKIASNLYLERRKTRNVITEKIDPFFQKNLLDYLKSSYFSLAIDTSTDLSKHNIMILNVTYLNHESKKICTNVYRIKENSDCTSDGFKDLIIKLLNEDKIPLHNIISLMSDGANVMSSDENGLYGKLKDKIQSLFYVGCLCHKLNLVITHALEELKVNIVEILKRISSHFNYSYKETHLLEGMEEICGFEKTLKIITLSNTRWFSILGVLTRIFKIYRPLIDTLEASSSGKDIAIDLKEPQNLMCMLIVKKVFFSLNELNALFMKETPQIHKIWKESIQKYRGLLNYICTQDIITKWNDDLLPSLDLGNKKKFISAELFFEKITNDIDFENFDLNLEDFPEKFKLQMFKWFIEVAKLMKKYLPFKDSILMAFQGLNPIFRREFSNIKVLLNRFKKLYPEEEKDAILEQIDIYRTMDDQELPFSLVEDNIDQFWFSLVYPPNNLPHIHGAAKKIRQLAKCFLNLCLVPHSNAPTEGTFKKMLKGISLKLTLLKA